MVFIEAVNAGIGSACLILVFFVRGFGDSEFSGCFLLGFNQGPGVV